MTSRLVTPETLAAALRYTYGYRWPHGTQADWIADAEYVLAAIPPDPRLDALLVAARLALRVLAENGPDREEDALRDALAAFEEKG